MAQGDVKSGLGYQIVSGSRMTVQPPAGEHWVIERVFSLTVIGTAPNKVAEVGVELYDGTNTTGLGDTNDPENSAALYGNSLRVFINNSLYARLKNTASAAANIGYSGLQIK